MNKESNSYDVFISHAAPDSVLAHQLAGLLRQAGLRVFDPDFALQPGDSIRDVLEDALAHSAHFVLLVSADYLASKWANFEMGVALGREPLAARRHVFPIIINDAGAKVLPLWLSNIVALHANQHTPAEIADKLYETIKSRRYELVAEAA